MNTTKLPKYLASMVKAEPGRVLRAEDKYSGTYWLADTEERALAAFYSMFLHNKDNEYYCDLENHDPDPELVELQQQYDAMKDNPVLAKQASKVKAQINQLSSAEGDFAEQEPLYKAAIAGNQVAAAQLILTRRGYEYEGFDFVDVCDPLKEDK